MYDFLCLKIKDSIANLCWFIRLKKYCTRLFSRSLLLFRGWTSAIEQFPELNTIYCSADHCDFIFSPQKTHFCFLLCRPEQSETPLWVKVGWELWKYRKFWLFVLHLILLLPFIRCRLQPKNMNCARVTATGQPIRFEIIRDRVNGRILRASSELLNAFEGINVEYSDDGALFWSGGYFVSIGTQLKSA